MFDALELIDVQLLDKLVLCLIPNFSQFLSKLRLKMIPLCNDDRFFFLNVGVTVFVCFLQIIHMQLIF